MWVPQRRPIGSLRAEGRWLVRVARVVETDINRVPERGALARDIAWSIAGSYIVRSSKRSIGRRVLLGPSCSARWVVRWLASKWSPEQ
jgi:hypothetical protein